MPQSRGREVTEELRSEIGGYLSRFYGGFSDARLGEFLVLSVGRILLKESRLGRDWRSVATDDELHHIADWLKASIINDDAWLSNVDYLGRPKKLMKFASIDQITREANKAMLKASQRLSGVKLVEGDEELYAELDDGYHIVRLLTPAALDRESAQMQHCIGDGAYDERLQSKYDTYLSLRDAGGNPHATLEIRHSALVQLQGKQNKMLVQKYIDKIIPFIKKRGLSVRLGPRDIGYVIDINEDWYDIHDLPEGLTVSGQLDLMDLPVTKLPKGLTVERSLILLGTRIKSLPRNLSVGGLYLNHTEIESLSEGLSIQGNLDLGDSRVVELPEGLTVAGEILLSGSKVTALPKRLSIGEDLNLRSTAVRTLSDEISIGGNFNLSGSGVTTLPRGLFVGGHLNLRGTEISSLPDDLVVGGNLDIEGSKISTIPEGVSVGGMIRMPAHATASALRA